MMVVVTNCCHLISRTSLRLLHSASQLVVEFDDDDDDKDEIFSSSWRCRASLSFLPASTWCLLSQLWFFDVNLLIFLQFWVSPFCWVGLSQRFGRLVARIEIGIHSILLRWVGVGRGWVAARLDQNWPEQQQQQQQLSQIGFNLRKKFLSHSLCTCRQPFQNSKSFEAALLLLY